MSSPSDQFPNTENRAVQIVLPVVGASFQVAVIRSFKNIGPKRSKQQTCNTYQIYVSPIKSVLSVSVCLCGYPSSSAGLCTPVHTFVLLGFFVLKIAAVISNKPVLTLSPVFRFHLPPVNRVIASIYEPATLRHVPRLTARTGFRPPQLLCSDNKPPLTELCLRSVFWVLLKP